jgi:transcription elongation factor GreA
MKEGEIQRQAEKIRQIGKELGEAAGANCDWHDNFAYEDARRRLDMETASLVRMKEDMSDSVVVEIDEQSNKVAFGNTVRALIGDQERSYTIGACGESAPELGLLTYSSPIGAAFMGMMEGDAKTVTIGGKNLTVEILEILPPSAKYRELIVKLAAR